MMLRYSIYILTLLLSVTSLCVGAEEAKGAGDVPDTESDAKLILTDQEEMIQPLPPGEHGLSGLAGKEGPPGTPCTAGSPSGPPCRPGSGSSSGHPSPILEAKSPTFIHSSQQAEKEGGEDGRIHEPAAVAEDGDVSGQRTLQQAGQKGNTQQQQIQPPPASLPTAANGARSGSDLNQNREKAQNQDQTSHGDESGSALAKNVQTLVQGGNVNENSQKNPEEQHTTHSSGRPNGISETSQSFSPHLQESSSAGTHENQQELNVNTDSSKGENTTNQGDTDSQSASTSTEPPATSSPQDAEETTTSTTANADNDTTPSEGSPTTTTTTTLPPELTNNKKGDADSSSSSISSSVWVRVPLLIVVTLSCILVC
ncbi:uncharacterized protein TM35_000811080 [Trypanosoma theileri]|uniref:Mucin TcMUCII n=1 Tax=Trypanosoma theileri TaxID=67003 RepID=A0A1X0NGE5_9TRYP|nr:uncharacterized protein TM35_000811080 [Trypanosoma theileri]ORC82958.1 hypothetical protein TM35_000811080 [Trypanosoma theileri]